MAIDNSGIVKNAVKISTIIQFLVFILALISFTAFLGLFIAIPAWIIAYMIMNSEVERANSGNHRFKKLYPFRYLGGEVSSFRHVYSYQEDIHADLSQAISQRIEDAFELRPLSPLSLTDIDNHLMQTVERTYLHSSAGMTEFGTDLHLVVNTDRVGAYAKVEWWVVLGGFIDSDKKFSFVAFAPLTIWFWLIGYLRNNVDVIGRLERIHDGEFNLQDTIFRIRALHEAVFDTLVAELEARGIDTSTLRMQQAQVLNIDISGGKVQMGNIMQGATNSLNTIAAKLPVAAPKAG